MSTENEDKTVEKRLYTEEEVAEMLKKAEAGKKDKKSEAIVKKAETPKVAKWGQYIAQRGIK